MGRGSEISFQMAPGVLTNRVDHIYATPKLSVWERTGNSLRTAKTHVANNSFDALDGILHIVDKQLNEVDAFWPPEAIHSSDHFKHLVKKAVHDKELLSWKSCITMSNALLQKAIKLHGRDSTKF